MARVGTEPGRPAPWRRHLRRLVVLSGLLVVYGCGALPRAPEGTSGPGASPRGQASATAPATLRQKLERLEARHRLVPYAEPAEAQQLFAMKRLPPGETKLPLEQYVKAQEQVRSMPRYSTRLGMGLPALAEPRSTRQITEALGTWSHLGPGNIGGRTRALVINPLDPQTMYAGGVAGGVWKTTNGGGLWTPLTDLIANIAVASLAMDPANPNVLYAGTGEGVFNFDAVRGAGIFRTTNAGATWTQLSSTATPDFHFVNKVLVSPNESQRLYAATRTGVWRSTNGGDTWTRMLDPNVSGGCLDLVTRTDLAVDHVLASCGTFAPATVYLNTDAGGAGAWTPVLTEPDMGRTSLAIAPSDQNVVYAIAASNASGTFRLGLHAVFRSVGGGAPGTWTARVRNTDPTKLNTVLLSNPGIAFLSDCGFGSGAFFNQGWYDNAIAVDPADPNRVWVGGIDLFRSDDGGANWGQASHWWANFSNPRYVHADQHGIVFHPQYNGATNRIVFAVNDGGVFRADDARAATATGPLAPCDTRNGNVLWVGLNNNYGVTQFHHGVPYPGGTTYFGGTQDNGTLRGTDAASVNAWRPILGGDGGYVAVDPTNPNILYAENTRLSLQKSVDGGATFNRATSGITESGANFLFTAPFAMDPGNPRILWIGGTVLWRTMDGAANWTQASAETAGQGSVSAIAIAPTDGNRVLVGMSDGFILRTQSGLTSGAATDFPSTRPRTGFVSSLTFDPTNPDIAYATYSTFGGIHVWRSADGGASWTGIDGSGATGIPDIPAHAVVVDPANSARLYVGTDLGVFVSRDGGANWAMENTGFANVITESLSVSPVGGIPQIFAFTHGRGAWRVPTLDVPATPSLRIGDASVFEGDAGTTVATFMVTLSPASAQAVTVAFATVPMTATTDVDFVPTAGTLTFAPGETARTVAVTVNGDSVEEGNEVFGVVLSTPVNALIVDGQAVGTILDDDGAPLLRVSDASVVEGNAGVTDAVFVVTLSRPSLQIVTVDFATASMMTMATDEAMTATAGVDYMATSGRLVFLPGVTNLTVRVAVIGDTLVEANEVFLLNLSNPTNAILADDQGMGIILDDDGGVPPSASRPVITTPATGSRFPLSLPTPVTLAWSAVPGADRYWVEYTGPNLAFTNANGTTPDPLNGLGGAGGGFVVVGTQFTIVLDATVPPGNYQARVIALDPTGTALGTFSDAITLGLGAVIPADAQPVIIAPAAGAVVVRGAPLEIVWTALPNAAVYLFEFTGPGGQFANPNGTAPDPVNALGRLLVIGTRLSVVVPPDLTPGAYQVRVIAVTDAGAPAGRFSGAVTLIVP